MHAIEWVLILLAVIAAGLAMCGAVILPRLNLLAAAVFFALLAWLLMLSPAA